MATKKKQPETLTFSSSRARRAIRVKDFINTSLKTFSLYDNVRSIPLLTDGLKPSQRKALYGTSLRGENANFIQVERLSAWVAASTDYHHGTGSMETTIAGMGATKYPGSNNMNLFVPEGQFGSRLTKEPGAGRYIETKLSSYFRDLFKKEDDPILEYNYVDGEKIEPKTYLPILPLVFLNGSSGTGTGHACEIKSYNPEHIRDVCLSILKGSKIVPGTLVPWFRGFHGTVTRNPDTGQIITTGKLEVVNTTTIKITELPVGTFLDKYKEFLNDLIEEGVIKDYDDASVEEGFEFTIQVPRDLTNSNTLEQLYAKFKMYGRDTENFTLWNINGVLQRYASAEDVIKEFVEWRVGKYEVRRQKQIELVTADIEWADEKIRFIQYYLKNTKMFSTTAKKDLIVILQPLFPTYEKLLSMPIWSLTKDRIADLEQELIQLGEKLDALESDTAVAMYTRELKAFKYDESVE